MASFDPPYPPIPSLLDLMRANAWAPPNLPVSGAPPSQLAGAIDDQWQPNPLIPASNVQPAWVRNAPFPQAPINAISPPTVLAASDQAPARPWWGGPLGPSIWDEWQKQNDKGNAGLYNFFRSFGGAVPQPVVAIMTIAMIAGKKRSHDAKSFVHSDIDIIRHAMIEPVTGVIYV